MNLSLSVALFMLVNLPDEPSPVPTGERDSPHCGIVSLYHLCAILGRPRSIDEVSAAASSKRASRQTSMAGLTEIASKLGLDLVGVKLDSTRRLAESPMILYLANEDHGHFITTRPVGAAGTLVQVFDGVQPTVILPRQELGRKRAWTALALVPRPDEVYLTWLQRFLMVGAVVAMIAIFLPRVPRRRASRESRAPDDSNPSKERG